MNVMLLDNGDPAIQELRAALEDLDMDTLLYRSDEIEVDEVYALAPNYIIVGSGEDTPADAGISLPLIRELAIETPILGIGLGHAAIGVAFGGRIIDVASPAYDIAADILHTGSGIFANMPSPLKMRVIPTPDIMPHSLPTELEVIAWTAEGQIMALRHRTLPTTGIKVRPETWSSEYGLRLLRNFLAQPST